jgi:putative glycosyltransferase (TIGR04372 family)
MTEKILRDSVNSLIENWLRRLRKVDFRLLTERVTRLALTPIWVLGVFILRAINLIKPVQLGGINAGRLGHLVMDVEMFLSEREIACAGYRKNVTDLRYVWTGGLPVSNRLILDLWRPYFRIGPRWILQPIDTWNRRLPGGKTTQVPWRKGPNTLNQHNDLHGALRRTTPHLPVTSEHFSLAREMLSRVRPNFNLDQPYVCIHVRDRSYFLYHQPHNRDDTSRNANIADYEPAIRFLAANSIQVVRMGAISEESLGFENDLVWDYAYDGSRSELLDVVLPARCEFFISTLSGPDKIAQLFRRPILFTNLAPLKSISLWMPNSLIAPKRLRYIGGRFLTWTEIFSSDLYTLNQEQLDQIGIELVPNSPEEIQMAVEELMSMTMPGFSDNAEVERDWQHLLDLIPPHLKSGGIRARIAQSFLSDPHT